MSKSRELVEILKSKNLKFSCAESFTGGGLASAIISVSGASAVFHEGIVAYSNEAKTERLKVKAETLEKYKPVSKEVASEMLDGITENCDVAVSTTGLAGPSSDESGFEVGLCFIGVSVNGKKEIYKFNLEGDRTSVINQGIDLAISLTLENLRRI